MRSRQPRSNPWRLQATLPSAVIKDISFASPTVGYIAAELGKVWKTTDGGNTWTLIMNLGYPYYWYGVDALSENDVVISGFDNSNCRGLLRWSHDGGQTWGQKWCSPPGAGPSESASRTLSTAWCWT